MPVGPSTIQKRPSLDYRSQWQRYAAAFFILSPFEFAFWTGSTITVLHRMLHFSNAVSFRKKSFMLVARVLAVAVRRLPYICHTYSALFPGGVFEYDRSHQQHSCCDLLCTGK
jgi:hypothetical protein